MTARKTYYGVRVSKEYLNFGAAHFLLFADGSREALHGHNYRVAVTLQGALDQGGVVVDFLVLKPLVKAICERLDHRTLLPGASSAVQIVERDGEVEVRHRRQRFVFPSSDALVLPLENISAEHLARYIADHLLRALSEHCSGARLEMIEVEVEETPGQVAFVRRHDFDPAPCPRKGGGAQ